jgi:transposase
MGKRKYRTVDVKDASTEGLLSRLASDRVVIGIDVAKHKMFACVMDEAQHVHTTIRWQHPEETRLFVAHLEAVRMMGPGVQVEVAMEPSGVYGDALRFEIERHGFEVYRVNPKRSHDAAEVYDGVPSLHDAKSSAIVAKLHLDSASHRWAIRTDQERELAAAVRVAEVFTKQCQQNRNRLEALTARHWPELTQILDLDSVTLLELLSTFGGPAAVAQSEVAARELMRRIGGTMLKAEKIERVLWTARSTIGQPQIEGERKLVQALAVEARRNQKAARQAVQVIERLTEEEGSVHEMRPVVGKKTAAVIVAVAGDPRNYESAAAFVKSLGLNLKEHSSGESKGGLHITKRGPGIVRMMLYMAVLRLIQTDEVVRAWYAKKVGRMGGELKTKAIVAIMRKLAGALWHVAKGFTFDARRLFDADRLGIPGMDALIPAMPDMVEA